MSSNTPTPQCIKRLAGELKLLRKNPDPHFDVMPDETNVLMWYFMLRPPMDTKYAGGLYIGRIDIRPTYPMSPPDFYMLTPSGRFQIESKICLSNSGYHADEWSAMWSFESIVRGFVSIFLDDTEKGISHLHEKDINVVHKYAKESSAYNVSKHPNIVKLFTRFVDENGLPRSEEEIMSHYSAPKIDQPKIETQQATETPPTAKKVVKITKKVVKKVSSTEKNDNDNSLVISDELGDEEKPKKVVKKVVKRVVKKTAAQ